MLEIISICLNVITIGLTVYELFARKSSNHTKQYIQNNIIQQINPKYDIKISSNQTDRLTNREVQNARWKSKRITQFAIALIYLSMIINFVNYIKINTIQSMTDFTAIIYIPIRNTMIQLSIMLILLCNIFIIRGWNKQQSVCSNFVSMKYFALKIITDILVISGLAIVDYSFIEKINANIQNLLYSFNFIGWSILLMFQLLWIRHTILKIYKLIPISTTYEEKEKQLFEVIPVYIVSILLFGLTIYIKFLQ